MKRGSLSHAWSLAGSAVIAFALFSALASPLKAQQSATIRVSANVIQVPLPHTVTDSVLDHVSVWGPNETGRSVTGEPTLLERGGVRMALVAAPVSDLDDDDQVVADGVPARRRVELLYIAN